ncbi:type III-B CRISPR module RAMP protein Cmr6 [Clostridium scatologenes]|uniref:CRISPR-associated RAMP protein, Cmr6 family n=1 Tax=Clostridium scatologenes TaxID=1548 RepID=A0A0E3GQ20_CLOSL|nr:type III-B CRISPR module RAMP protein Cmr6 [Clostridium scatologenes]AKA67806.1 CRISPR-associated RAMP protein, Cmr6 family [Clostridium scatologenes]
MAKCKFYLNTDNLRFDTLERSNNVELDSNNINNNLILNKYIYEKIDFKNYKFNQSFQSLLEYIKEKQEHIVELYKDNYICCKESFSLNECSKLAIGLGEVSVREVSIKLDHIYGIPFIPASSLKGAFRSYLNEKYSKSNNKENIIITELFGTEDKKGKIIFFDAYPEKFQLGLDIMTPHYIKYYSNGEKPLDSLKPNPIKFPVVKEGAKFKFTILCEKNYFIELNKLSKEKFKFTTLYKKLKHMLDNLNRADLKKLGEKNKFKKSNIQKEFEQFLKKKPLGAKTSVGYGCFEKLK